MVIAYYKLTGKDRQYDEEQAIRIRLPLLCALSVS
jgi:hypothetical protein